LSHLDYAQISPSDWEEQLKHLSQGGTQKVLVPIYWGHHETLCGAPDFHSKSRLKLEKLFLLAQNLSVPIDLKIGFFDSERSFPVWAKALQYQTIVPQWSLSRLLGEWQFVQVPSLQNVELKEAFFNFVKEVLSIASLYRAPEGTIKSVNFTAGLICSEAVIFNSDLIRNHFESRYGSMVQFNKAFQSNFSHFEALATQRGFKTILEKRPWLTCWEFKALREKLYSDYFTKLKTILDQCNSSTKESDEIEAGLSEKHAVFDDVLLETSPLGKNFLHLAPQGELNSSVLQAFQINELIKLELGRRQMPFVPLSFWDAEERVSNLSVVCSKYLPAQIRGKILRAHSKGAKINFVFEKPSWDENLNHLDWPLERVVQGRGLSEFI